MKAEHLETGKMGEEKAREYLKEKGYQILATNWRFGLNEIDIIAKKDGYLVIVEVKTRTGQPLVEPEVAVDQNKQRQLIKAANSYIHFNNINMETRFDILAITVKGSECAIHHIEDAFYPRLRR